MNRIVKTLFTPLSRLVASLGGWLYILCLLAIIVVGSSLNFLSRAVTGLEIPKNKLWLLLLERALMKIMKVGSDVWNGLLNSTALADQASNDPEEKHQLVDSYLQGQGIKDGEWRKRLIQAAVLQRRLLDLIELWSALGTPKKS